MQEAPTPSNESRRLESLWKLQILDTPPEERFDRITKLATQMFRVPISTITLVDKNREWFKSVCGLDQHEGDRAISFCGHALVVEDLLVVPDTQHDPRFSDNPMVVGAPFIRFYAGVPLFSADGERVGVFCIKGREPREMSSDEQEALKSIAKWAELEINAHNLSLALDQIKQSVADLNAFFETAEDFMCIANPEGHFTRVNSTFGRVLGYAEEEMVRTPFLEFIHPADVGPTTQQMQKLMAGERITNFVNRYRAKDGRYITLQWTATPHGKQFYAIARNITEAKAREDELRHLNEAMVNRELKMIELKRRIKELETGRGAPESPAKNIS